MAKRVLIYGVRHQGKSTLSMALALKSRTDAGYLKSIIIFDPNAQFDGYYTTRDPEDFRAWLEMPVAERWRIIVYRPTPGRISEDFQVLCDLLGGDLWDQRNYVLIVDEAAILQRSNSMHPGLDRYLRQAPPDIDVIQSMHRQVDSNTLGRTLVTDTFFFFTDQSRELKQAEDQFGPEVAAILPTLGRHQFLHCWSEYGRRKYAIIRDPGRWYVRINGNARTGISGPVSRGRDSGRSGNAA